MRIINKRLYLLNMCVLMSDDVHKAVFGIRIHPIHGAKGFEANLNARHWAAYCHWLTMAHCNCHRREC